MASRSTVNTKNEAIKEKEEVDKEENLDDLLESALGDFETVKEKELTSNIENVISSEEFKNDMLRDLPIDPVMNEVYEQLFTEFNNLQTNLLPNKPSTSSSNLAPSLSQPPSSSSQPPSSSSQPPSSSSQPPSSSHKPPTAPSANTSSIPDDISKTLQEALKSLNDFSTPQSGAEGLSEADLAQLMAELGRGEEGLDADGDASPEHMMPLMQSMMQNLLSKELLYLPLKEISAKYPAWIAENEGGLKGEETQRYKQQYSMMHAMVQLYEEEQPQDSKEVKDKRFERLLDLMQGMQQLGTPPKEIAGDFAGFDTDELGFPKGLDGAIPPVNQCATS